MYLKINHTHKKIKSVEKYFKISNRLEKKYFFLFLLFNKIIQLNCILYLIRKKTTTFK